MSRYFDLLKQIPPGQDEEIPEELEKELKRAAYRLATTQSGQADISPEKRQELLTSNNSVWSDSAIKPEKLDIDFEDDGPILFQVRDGSRILTIGKGSRGEFWKLEQRLKEIRAKGGISAFEAEVRRLRNAYLREKGLCHDDFEYSEGIINGL